MSDALSASGLLAPGTTGGREDATILIRDVSFGAVLEIGSWPNRLETVAKRLGELCEGEVPGRPGRFSAHAPALLGWLAFGRFLWLSAEAEDTQRIDEAFPEEDAAVVDLAPARHLLRISGADAPALLNKAVTIDFDPKAFDPGSLAQSVIHQVPVVILRRSVEDFDLLIPSSLIASFTGWLTEAAEEFGYTVGEPVPILTQG